MRLTRRGFWGSSLAALGAAKERKPNCYNPASKLETPHVDQLAKQGMRCTDAHSPSAVCTPTRYALLTGRYSWRSRLKSGVLPTNSAYLIEPHRTTMPMLLRQQGYRTAIIGKWHLGLTNGGKWDLGGLLEPGPLAAGFDRAFVLPSVFSEDPYCFIDNGRVAGKMNAEPESRHFYQRENKIRTQEGWKDEELGPVITRKAVEFIEAQKDQPFFLFVPTSAPHDPHVPPGFVRGKSGAGLRGDSVMEFDWTVGRIGEALKRSGQAENTLLVVTSDHGPRPSGEDGETFWTCERGHPARVLRAVLPRACDSRQLKLCERERA